MHRLNTVAISAVLMLLSSSVHAYVFHVDRFSVEKNSSTLFTDNFDDGNPPPDAPTLSYVVTGSMGPETGGKLTLDSSGAVPVVLPLGNAMLIQSAILTTNIDPANTDAGLKADDIFAVKGLFDLTLPDVTRANESYGINLTDRALGLNIPGDDIVGIRVININGDLKIQFFETSFLAGTFTPVSAVPLDVNHDQILFELSRSDPSTNAVTAAFAYFDGGVMVGDMQSMPGSADIFNTQNWTRAQFVSRTAVPVPAAVWLFSSGLIGLAALARRHARSIGSVAGRSLAPV